MGKSNLIVQFVRGVAVLCFLVLFSVISAYAEIIYFSDNFENGLGNWVVIGLDWDLTETDARSATHSITDSPSGNYPNYANAPITLAHPMDLSATTAPILSFWHKYSFDNSGWPYGSPDYGYVEVSEDGGLTWTSIASYTGYSSTWSRVTLDLAQYKGNPILLRYRVVSEGNGRVADGWYIDDVEIKEKDTATTAFPFIDNFENGLGNWVVSSREWDLTETDARSATHSITDSPSGNYPNYANAPITLAHPMDLSATTAPILSFWHKYSFDNSGWPYMEVKGSNLSY